MDNGEKKISSLFDGRTIFKVPEYQRAYAWGEQQLSDFIEDINNQKVDRSYFLGTVLFEEKGLEGNYDVIDIVDGQQRITTIIIFMSVLIEKLRAMAETDDELEDIGLLYETYVKHRKQYKLRALEEDNDFFHSYILSDINGKDFIRTPAQRRLYDAKKYLSKKLSTLSKEELETIKTKIDENSRILVYSVKDTAEATLIFETTNDRGKGLTNLEKIKSFMMYKSYIASDDTPDSLLTKIRTRFSDIYKEHEKFNSSLDEDSILQYHFVCYGNWTQKEYQQHVQSVKNTVNTMISNGNHDQAIKYIDQYTRELKESFFATHELLNSKIKPLRDIFLLTRVGNFWPLLLKTYKMDASNDKRHFTEVAKILAIFSFRVYAINENRGNTGKSKLFSLAKKFKGDFENLTTSLKDITNDYAPDKMFKGHLEDEYLYQWLAGRDLNFFFWKYENYLRVNIQPKASPMSEEELTNENSKLKLSIEHIACQTPKETVVTNIDTLPLIDEEFEENHLHCIGNLTIDPLSANSSKGNKNFDEKNEGYFLKAPFKTQNELENYLDHGKWTSKSIGERTERLIEFALVQWAIH